MKTKDLDGFELQLRQLKEILRSNIERLEGEIEIIATEDEIDDSMDMASLESDMTDHKALLRHQIKELEEVDHALSKIKDGTYGICEKSGDKIPLERLHARPHTRYCLDDAKEVERDHL